MSAPKQVVKSMTPSTGTYESVTCADLKVGDRYCMMPGFPLETVTSVKHGEPGRSGLFTVTINGNFSSGNTAPVERLIP